VLPWKVGRVSEGNKGQEVTEFRGVVYSKCGAVVGLSCEKSGGGGKYCVDRVKGGG